MVNKYLSQILVTYFMLWLQVHACCGSIPVVLNTWAFTAAAEKGQTFKMVLYLKCLFFYFFYSMVFVGRRSIFKCCR